MAEPMVSRVQSQADVPAKLAALGIKPDAQPAAPTTLMSVRRSDAAAKTDYYWLYNQGIDQVPPTTGVLDGTPENVFEEPSAVRQARQRQATRAPRPAPRSTPP